ncbi:unnamed protein product [Diabrotica balteata]|uniref:PHD-type domain-containing protein n=1 Tax=Diabrotica balteata TaxID=107213 RepID=A0A9N9XKZ2_DIABA|nr:unnamed protein product [Diabrotica balteata]
MLERMVELRDAVKTTIASINKKDLPVLTEEEWSTCSELVTALKPFEDVTRAISGEHYLTGSKVVGLTNGLISVCRKMLNEPFNDTTNRVLNKLLSALKTRMVNIEQSKTIALTSLLDSRFKLAVFKDQTAAEEIKKHCSQLMARIWIEQQQNRPTMTTINPVSDTNIDVVSSEAGEVNREQPKFSVWEDLDLMIASKKPTVITINGGNISESDHIINNINYHYKTNYDPRKSEDTDTSATKDTVPNPDIYLNPIASSSNRNYPENEHSQSIKILKPVTNTLPPLLTKAFYNHLKTPSAISSSEWRKFYQEKENDKKIKILDIAKKKEERERLRGNKQKKTAKAKETKTKQKKPKKKQNTKISEKISCADCNEAIQKTMTKKNIGCDLCDKWYHKKCTTFVDTPYYIAAVQDYKCDKCSDRSGVEEVYTERDRCLQEIAEMCADLTLAPPPKKRRTISKEKQIIELGRNMRDNHSSVYVKSETRDKTEVVEVDHSYVILPEHRGEEVIVDNVVAEEVESIQNTPYIPRTLGKAEDNKKQIMGMFIYPKFLAMSNRFRSLTQKKLEEAILNLTDTEDELDGELDELDEDDLDVSHMPVELEDGVVIQPEESTSIHPATSAAQAATRFENEAENSLVDDSINDPNFSPSSEDSDCESNERSSNSTESHESQNIFGITSNVINNIENLPYDNYGENSKAELKNERIGKTVTEDFCYFFVSLVKNFARHIKRNHSVESEVQKILSLPADCKPRKDLITTLRKRGNFLNNNRIQKPVKKPNLTNTILVPCSNCLGFYSSKMLWRHRKQCPGATKTNSKIDGQNILLKGLRVDPELQQKVFPRMGPDEISMAAK